MARRPKRRTSWIDRHNAWLDTPAGSFDDARYQFNAKQALGWPAYDEVLRQGRRAIEIGERHGFDVGGLKEAVQQFEARVAAENAAATLR